MRREDEELEEQFEEEQQACVQCDHYDAYSPHTMRDEV